jgi:hypothetical protein
MPATNTPLSAGIARFFQLALLSADVVVENSSHRTRFLSRPIAQVIDDQNAAQVTPSRFTTGRLVEQYDSWGTLTHLARTRRPRDGRFVRSSDKETCESFFSSWPGFFL